MGIKQIHQPLKQFLSYLPRNIKVDQLIIFGSHMEGRATADSDIDVLVISDAFKKLDEDQRLDILYDATDDIQPDIHPWGFTKEELQTASHLTLLGYARDHGIHFPTKSA